MISPTRMIDLIRNPIKACMGQLAVILNRLSGGRITPTSITLIGLSAHVVIAYLIAMNMLVAAAIMLLVFGLFDALDGALARIQGTADNAGMLLDASTDRMKEVMLYTGAAYALVAENQAYWAVWAVVACGSSLVVSYVKAKGETAVAGGKLSANEVNRLFQDGIMRYEIRMFFLFVGLLVNRLSVAIVLIAISSVFTAITRLIGIMRKLK